MGIDEEESFQQTQVHPWGLKHDVRLSVLHGFAPQSSPQLGRSRPCVQASSLVEIERALYGLAFSREPTLLPDVPVHRQQMMRRLVRDRIRHAILRAIPHAHRLAGDEVIEECIAEFLESSPPTTRALHSVPRQFADFIASREDGAQPHDSFAEIVHWEVLELEVLFAPDPTHFEPGMEWTAHPSARLCAYRHDVTAVDRHTIAWPVLLERPLFLVASRLDERFRWHRLSPGCAQLLAAVAGGEPHASARKGFSPDVLNTVDHEIADLIRDGVLLCPDFFTHEH